jgi:two-component system sensor histidine kinase KdpD
MRVSKAKRAGGRVAAYAGWWCWPAALGITALCTAVAFPLYSRFDPVNLVMLYLLGATVAGLWLGRGASVLCVMGNVAAFDYCFVPPRYSFYVAEPQYLLTLFGMMIVALVIANLMVSVRRHSEAVAARERRTAMLYAMSRELAGTAEAVSIAAVATPHVSAAVEGEAAIVLATDPAESARPIADATVVQWVLQQGLPAGPGTTHCVGSSCLYLPLAGDGRTNGVLVVRPHDGTDLPPEPRYLLDALAGLIAMALERARLAEVAAQSRAAAERAVLRNTVLASISHDLRAPLTAIAAAGCLVAQQGEGLDSRRRQTLGQLIEAKARDLGELLNNVLELIRLESATAPPRADWQSVEELVGAALRQTMHRFDCVKVLCDIPDDLPLLYVDGQLIRQLLSNLLENAAKYTPAHTTVMIRAIAVGDCVRLTVEDDGPGFGSIDPELLFEKFERGQKEGHVSGAGLGLAICRAVARLHGGSIRAMNRAGGGARFELLLPRTAARSALAAQG